MQVRGPDFQRGFFIASRVSRKVKWQGVQIWGNNGKNLQSSYFGELNSHFLKVLLFLTDYKRFSSNQIRTLIVPLKNLDFNCAFQFSIGNPPPPIRVWGKGFVNPPPFFSRKDRRSKVNTYKMVTGTILQVQLRIRHTCI